MKKITDLSIKHVGLSNRAINCCLHHGIQTIEDLCNCTQYEIKQIRNLGEKTFTEIVTFLRQHNLSFLLGDEFSYWRNSSEKKMRELISDSQKNQQPSSPQETEESPGNPQTSPKATVSFC